MKLINLIPLREVEEGPNPELIATPYFREFQTAHGYKPMWKYIGTKSEEHIFVADLNNFGQLDLIISDANNKLEVERKNA